jgi:hypothetical protein
LTYQHTGYRYDLLANATTKLDEHEEIEVTEEMIEAGYRVLPDSALVDYPLEADKLTVCEIYQAMRRLSPAKS